jgi:hypothetical protein
VLLTSEWNHPRKRAAPFQNFKKNCLLWFYENLFKLLFETLSIPLATQSSGDLRQHKRITDVIARHCAQIPREPFIFFALPLPVVNFFTEDVETSWQLN